MSETIFHKIIRNELPADKVYEDDLVVAFRDISPAAPSHILIVPKKDLETVNSIESGDEQLVGHMVYVAKRVAQDEGIDMDGYRLVINCGPNGGQVVMQLHMHLLGGRRLAWPPG